MGVGLLVFVLGFVAYMTVGQSDDTHPVPKAVFGTVMSKVPDLSLAVPLPPQPSTPPLPPEEKRAEESQVDKPQPNVARNLQIARASLQKNDLSTARATIMEVVAAEPNNGEALRMRADLIDREQRRDAALGAARLCEKQEQWTCAWHHAGNALVIDTTNAEAKRLLSRAIRESEIARAHDVTPKIDPVNDR